MQLSELRRRAVNEKKMPTFCNGSTGDSNPGSLDCESGILQRSTLKSVKLSENITTKAFVAYVNFMQLDGNNIKILYKRKP